MLFPCDDWELPVEYCAFTAHDARRRARPRAAGVRRRPSHRRVAVQGDILPRARVCRPQKTSFDKIREKPNDVSTGFQRANLEVPTPVTWAPSPWRMTATTTVPVPRT